MQLKQRQTIIDRWACENLGEILGNRTIERRYQRIWFQCFERKR